MSILFGVFCIFRIIRRQQNASAFNDFKANYVLMLMRKNRLGVFDSGCNGKFLPLFYPKVYGILQIAAQSFTAPASLAPRPRRAWPGRPPPPFAHFAVKKHLSTPDFPTMLCSLYSSKLCPTIISAP